jgi:hypothetical protein
MSDGFSNQDSGCHGVDSAFEVHGEGVVGGGLPDGHSEERVSVRLMDSTGIVKFEVHIFLLMKK